ncbi:MAG: transglutaminase domain-containing protein [Chitinophagaceae bacterium]
MYAQSPSVEWDNADRFILAQNQQITTRKDLDLLIKKIRLEFTEPALRVRACYAWVTGHINYATTVAYDKGLIDSVLKYKETDCEGYTVLFQYMCKQLDISCAIITGFGRTADSTLYMDTGNVPTDHGWCAVRVDGRWHLIDITWASGFSDGKTNRFIRNRNDWYYFTPPEKFIYDHLPKDTIWQLLLPAMTAEAFFNQPLQNYRFTEGNVKAVSPATAVIYRKQGDTICFRFHSDLFVNTINLSSDAKPVHTRGRLRHNNKDKVYEYVYVARYPGDYTLNIELGYEYVNPQGRFTNQYADITYRLVVDASGEMQNKELPGEGKAVKK